jgi:hypothetical protein
MDSPMRPLGDKGAHRLIQNSFLQLGVRIMARIRHVHPTDMVAHLWAHQSQDSARNGGNFYFEGDTLYSYGAHFPLPGTSSARAVAWFSSPPVITA